MSETNGQTLKEARQARDYARAFYEREQILFEEIDEGTVLVENFVDVSGAGSVIEIYNKLYPYYAVVVSKILDAIRHKLREDEQSEK